MVTQTLIRLVRSKGPDEFWRKRRIFKLSAHFRGRSRNCYSLAIRAVNRALQFASKGRKLRLEDMKELCKMRVAAGAEELGLTYEIFKKGLRNSDVLLNNKVLADLAIWEPRTFKENYGSEDEPRGLKALIQNNLLVALTQFAWSRGAEDGLNGVDKLGKDPPDNVVTRGMLKKKDT